ncbi:MAG: helix-turn-helix domain-containing protein [Chloroflexota bacterium]|nr:helix-turn-helix domain-containing protein [Chloroflexota bacterium]
MPEILTVDELAEYLKMSRAKIYQMAQRGELPAAKIGAHWRFRKDIIDIWLLEHIEATAPQSGDGHSGSSKTSPYF